MYFLPSSSKIFEITKLSCDLEHLHRLQPTGPLAGVVAREFNNVLLPLMLYTDLALEACA